jgi:hypothetical protein
MTRGGLKKGMFFSCFALLTGGAIAAGGCSSTPAGNDGGGLPDGNMMSDGTVMDTGVDGKKPDTGVDSGPPMCPTPVMLMNFMPPAFVNPNPIQNVCSQTDIQGFWDNCRGPQATQNTCNTWKGGHGTCYSCLFTQRSDQTWGALVYGNNITFLNTSGCLALFGDPNCAKAEQALGFCSYAACDPRCMVTDFFAPDHGSTLQDWQACDCSPNGGMCTPGSANGQGGPCSSFVTAVNNACPVDAGNAESICFNFQSFQDGYFLYAPLFCGGGG